MMVHGFQCCRKFPFLLSLCVFLKWSFYWRGQLGSDGKSRQRFGRWDGTWFGRLHRYVVFLFILLLVLSILPLMLINMCLYCQVPQNLKTYTGLGNMSSVDTSWCCCCSVLIVEPFFLLFLRWKLFCLGTHGVLQLHHVNGALVDIFLYDGLPDSPSGLPVPMLVLNVLKVQRCVEVFEDSTLVCWMFKKSNVELKFLKLDTKSLLQVLLEDSLWPWDWSWCCSDWTK